MAAIKKITGTGSSLSPISLAADERHLFEAINWASTITAGKDKVTWRLKDATRKIKAQVIKENALKEESVAVTINKKYSGNVYTLEAELKSTGEKAVAFISGFCDKKIINSEWSKKKGGVGIKNNSKSDTISFGDLVFLHLETEGLNGSNVIIEVYTKDKECIIEELKGNVVNGEVNLKIKSTFSWRIETDWKVSGTKQFYIKVRDRKGNYILDNSGKDLHAKFLNIENKIASKNTSTPENLVPTKIGKIDFETLSVGILSLEKIIIDTDYEVCSDEVDKFDDYENFWILENKGKYYHWVKERNKINGDENKPPELPFTISSSVNLKFKATFKTLLPADGIEVRVKDSIGKYTFSTKSHPKKNKDDLYEIEFESINTPYKDTVQYFPNFKLIFEYSFDKKVWIPLGVAPFCFYLTYGNPGYNIMSTPSYPGNEKTNKIINDKTKNKAILESLLYIGCKYAKGASSLNKIVEKVFAHIETRNVERARNSSAMGYWRNTSSLHKFSSSSFWRFRGVRYLLKYGEACCGEWSYFFSDICKIQSDLFHMKFSLFSIYPKGTVDLRGFKNSCFLVKTWKTHDPKSPIDNGGKAQDLSNEPLNMFWDHVFIKYNNKYYDPSYGLSSKKTFVNNDDLLADYSKKALSGVLYAKLDLSKTEIDAIIYKPDPTQYLNPLTNYVLSSTDKNKNRYKTVKTSMEKELLPRINII